MQPQAEKDILSELTNFINGATQTVKTNPLDLSKTALNLLKTLPTAREAILEYFCTVFDVAVKNYIICIETEIATGEMPQTCSREEATVSEIHSVLCNFIQNNPQAWAPIISTWSLELLGELSSKYAGRAHVPLTAGLNETLQLWMDCRSTRTLIDITTQCLTCVMNTDSETWMNALLDTSVKHSPHFDWVVAHVGSCFPNTVITKVLSCGLKDFCQHKSIETGKQAPKLSSVVGILGHLAASHFEDIRTALLELFAWSLLPYSYTDNEIKSQKTSTVPFLLQLASMSPTLLNAMSTNIRHTLKGSIILRLHSYIHDWCRYFGSPKALQDLTVKLILNCEIDGFQIIQLLLDHIHLTVSTNYSKENVANVKETCWDILEYILQEIDSIVRVDQNCNNIKLLGSLMKDTSDLHDLLLQNDRLKYESATRIIILIGKCNSTVAIKSACFLLQSSRTLQHLAMFVKLIYNIILNNKTELNFAYSNVIGQILKLTLIEIYDCCDYETNNNVEQMWKNLLVLLKWEKTKQIPMLHPGIISNAILSNIDEISYHFGSNKTESNVRHILADIFHITITSNAKNLEFPPHLIFSITNSIANYFFMCCSENNRILKTKGIKIVCDLFEILTNYSKAARVIALRELLEKSMFFKESLLFGAELSDDNDTDYPNKDLLLYKNHKHSTTMMLTQRHSSVFHSGIIGNGKRKPKKNNLYSKEIVTENIEQLLQVVKACCYANSFLDEPLKKSPVSLDALTLVALLLVQFVSPDVMYNGLPWPEEEFSKV